MAQLYEVAVEYTANWTEYIRVAATSVGEAIDVAMDEVQLHGPQQPYPGDLDYVEVVQAKAL